MTTLLDQTGNTVELKTLTGPKVVFFGYSHCPDMCPAALSQLSMAMKALGKNGNKVTPIFISLDPSRDTYKALGSYIKQFNEKKLRAFTGDIHIIRTLAQDFGVNFKFSNASGINGSYGVDHTGFYYLLDNKNGLLKALPAGLAAPPLAMQIRQTLISD